MFTKNKTRGRQSAAAEYHEDFVEIVRPAEEPFENQDDAAGSRRKQQRGYMAELEDWLNRHVFEPIEQAITDEDSKELQIAFNEGKRQIKQKVLDSYHNGLKAKSNAR